MKSVIKAYQKLLSFLLQISSARCSGQGPRWLSCWFSEDGFEEARLSKISLWTESFRLSSHIERKMEYLLKSEKSSNIAIFLQINHRILKYLKSG